MARPTSLTPDVQAAVVQALTAGNTLRTAAEYAGIAYSSLMHWLKLGRREGASALHAGFRAAVEKAKADSVVRNVALIQQAAATSWQAAAWWLERMLPETFSRDSVLIRQLERQVRDLERRLADLGRDAPREAPGSSVTFPAC